MFLVDTTLGARGTEMSKSGHLPGSDSWAATQVHSGCKPRGNHELGFGSNH